jgi:hypothetical protein
LGYKLGANKISSANRMSLDTPRPSHIRDTFPRHMLHMFTYSNTAGRTAPAGTRINQVSLVA